jgi:hypothetical protein
MGKHRVLTRALLVALIFAPLVACSPTAQRREVLLTFDGKVCRYEGPEVVTEGELTVTLVNESNYEADLWVVKLGEGRSWQDMVDFIGVPGSNVHPPDWSSGSIMKAVSADKPDATVLFVREGLYAICCCTCYDPSSPNGVWPGGSLEVRAE